MGFFRTTQELEFFFCCEKREFFFQNLTLGYDKNSESDYFFFPPPKSEYFFQQHWESEYFFRKKTYPPPFKLNGRSLVIINLQQQNTIISESSSCHSIENLMNLTSVPHMSTK